MSVQALYFNACGIIHTRERWIDIFEYQLRTRFLKDRLESGTFPYRKGTIVRCEANLVNSYQIPTIESTN